MIVLLLLIFRLYLVEGEAFGQAEVAVPLALLPLLLGCVTGVPRVTVLLAGHFLGECLLVLAASAAMMVVVITR